MRLSSEKLQYRDLIEHEVKFCYVILKPCVALYCWCMKFALGNEIFKVFYQILKVSSLYNRQLIR